MAVSTDPRLLAAAEHARQHYSHVDIEILSPAELAEQDTTIAEMGLNPDFAGTVVLPSAGPGHYYIDVFDDSTASHQSHGTDLDHDSRLPDQRFALSFVNVNDMPTDGEYLGTFPTFADAVAEIHRHEPGRPSADTDVAGVAAMLEALNNPAVADVWEEVVNPRLTDEERYDVDAEAVWRGTFVHQGIHYGVSHYSGEWTTLPVEDDVDLVERSAFSQAVTAARQTIRAETQPTPIEVPFAIKALHGVAQQLPESPDGLRERLRAAGFPTPATDAIRGASRSTSLSAHRAYQSRDSETGLEL